MKQHETEGGTAVKLCRCGKFARPKQRNCHKCHALANQIYRVRKDNELKQLRALKRSLIIKNIITDTR